MNKFLGFIAYEGPSEIDGKPIVVIINKLNGSKNIKTGDVVQSFIIRSDINPVKALQTGDDLSICGECEHRPSKAKNTGAAPCYVNVGRSVFMVYNAYKRGRYTRSDPATIAAALKDKIVRLGTYGDPFAAPYHIWSNITRYTQKTIGYTHQWQNAKFNPVEWAPLVMASADNIDQAAHANLLGMRVFRVSIGLDRQPLEVICPASSEGGKKTLCSSCKLCSGTSIQALDIVIADHGLGHKKRVFMLERV